MSDSGTPAAPRIALIHALTHSVAPINEAFARDWPDVVLMNLLDDSLSADLARSGRGLDEAMHRRFMTLTDYAVSTGAQGILFTCSAFGPCIEAAARRHSAIPVLKPNEAMVDAAVALLGSRSLGLLASFPPTLQSMPSEFPTGTSLELELAEGALDALNRGDTATHDARAVEAAQRLKQRGCEVIALAQFSLARAADAVRQATGLTVLTTVDSAVARLRSDLTTRPSSR